MRIRTQPPNTATPGTRPRDTNETTNPDCVALGCDWAWGTEPCPCGQPHTVRICGRCLICDDPVCTVDSSDIPDDEDDAMWAEVAA